MDALWQIRLLGTLEARQGKIVLTHFATSRVAALLARLALFPARTHSREELAGVLWPDADTDAGRLNLRVALSSLRRQLEPPGSAPGSVLVTDRLSIRLHPHACMCDAAQFESALRQAGRTPDPARKREMLEKALALYEGELLPGFYDEWILDERQRLQALRDDAETSGRALPRPIRLPEPPAPAAPEPAETPKSANTPLGFPGQFTRFFGRSMEQGRLSALLADPAVRLVTLLGPGGSGKTRLAGETARLAAGGFGGPVCFVPLADISDPALLISTVASALHLPQAVDRSPLEHVAAALSPSPLVRSLLVLDNLEHLGTGGAAEVRLLLEKAPRLTCLVTSRQKLSLEGEYEMQTAPLPVPSEDDLKSGLKSGLKRGEAKSPNADTLAAYSSVQLFVDRAQAVRPEFQITSENESAVVAVCRSLEGLPLALELAAARIQALSPGQMQTQLEARLDFLTSRRNDLPPRHRSLRAALEWSAQLLSPELAYFFAQLSIFRGGWSLEAAAAVCEVPEPLLLLEQLCERSLISTVEAPGELRFRMLEALREFGEEQLTPEERQALARRHAAYFRDLAARMDALWNSPRQGHAQTVLDGEQDNLRAALTFCRDGLSTPDWPGNDSALRLAASLGNYWTVRGLLHEGLEWLEDALSRPGSEAARARAMAMAGWLTGGLCDYLKAEALLTESVALSRRLGDERALSSALRIRGVIKLWEGTRSPSDDFEEALALSRAAGDDPATAITLNGMGVMAEQWDQDKDKAGRLYEEAMAIFLRLGDQQRTSYCLHNLGNLAYDAGDHDRAVALGRHSLALADAIGDHWHRAYCLRSLGDALMGSGDLPAAALLLEEGRTLSRRLGDRSTEAGILLSLASVRRRQSDLAEASALARAALLLAQAVCHAAIVAECWMNLAETAAASRKWKEVTALLSAADTCRPVPTEGDQYARRERLHASRLRRPECRRFRRRLGTRPHSQVRRIRPALTGGNVVCDPNHPIHRWIKARVSSDRGVAV